LISVRKAIAKDINDIVQLLSAMGFNDEDIYTDKDYFVYYDNDVLLGCGMAFAVRDYCIIDNILVDEKNRRNKIGTAIAKTIMNFYERNGAKIALSFGKCDAFFKSLGFSIWSDKDLPNFIKNILKKDLKQVYAVSLEGYFKNCC
jgi:N-acetylglutamate synthase-like GNAT family acetyltransferase